MLRIQRVLHNASILEARDREEQRLQRLTQASDSEAARLAVTGRPVTVKKDSSPQPRSENVQSTDPWNTLRNDEPEAWSPRVVRR
jgi:hypothetical protein